MEALNERHKEIARTETRVAAIVSVINDPIRKHWSLASRVRLALEQYDPATALLDRTEKVLEALVYERYDGNEPPINRAEALLRDLRAGSGS